MRRHNFTFENFAQEKGQKISKHAHKVGKNGQKIYKMKEKNIINFPAWTFKSKKIAQSQQNCGPSHDGETVTFRNSGKQLTYILTKLVLNIQTNRPYTWSDRFYFFFKSTTFGYVHCTLCSRGEPLATTCKVVTA